MGRKSKEEIERAERTRKKNDWNRKNQKRFNIALNIKKDAEVIKKLESVPNKVDYVRNLILADIHKDK